MHRPCANTYGTVLYDKVEVQQQEDYGQPQREVNGVAAALTARTVSGAHLPSKEWRPKVVNKCSIGICPSVVWWHKLIEPDCVRFDMFLHTASLWRGEAPPLILLATIMSKSPVDFLDYLRDGHLLGVAIGAAEGCTHPIIS
jgi:hypothetical protein